MSNQNELIPATALNPIGMSLRDWFAGTVLNAHHVFADRPAAIAYETWIAINAYRLADAMLAQREQDVPAEVKSHGDLPSKERKPRNDLSPDAGPAASPPEIPSIIIGAWYRDADGNRWQLSRTLDSLVLTDGEGTICLRQGRYPVWSPQDVLDAIRLGAITLETVDEVHRKIRIIAETHIDLVCEPDESYTESRLRRDRAREALVDDITTLVRNIREKYIHAGSKYDYDVCQVLGQAIGYPVYANDQKTFPGAEGPEVCVGEHVALTLAREAAEIIKNCRCRFTKEGDK